MTIFFNILGYVEYGLILVMAWVGIIHTWMIRPLDQRMSAYSALFEQAYSQGYLDQMLLALEEMHRIVNKHRRAMLVSLNPFAVYPWLRGRLSPLPRHRDHAAIYKNSRH